MLFIDRLSYQSKLRYVNASEKFVYAMLTLVLCIVEKSFLTAVSVFAVNGILTVGKGGIPLSRYIRLLLVPVLFLILGAAAIIINVSEVPLDAFACPVGEWYITGSRQSVLRAAELTASALGAVTCLYFLALNTTMPDLLQVLKKLHIPALVIELMMLIYRFIFLLSATASAISTAQEARLGKRTFRTRVRAFGGMASVVFILAIRRSGAVYDAMESRCYDGEIRVLGTGEPAKIRENLLIVLFETALLAATVWSVLQ